MHRALIVIVAVVAAPVAAPAPPDAPAVAGTAVAASSPSPYAGFVERPVKALSADEVAGLRQGRGMGMALAAELNGYPGPMHVLELADRLELTAEQRQATERAFDAMHRRAVELGEQVVEREARLDRLFAEGAMSQARLKKLSGEIAALRGRLRAAHLAAHLEMKRVLTPEQVARYDALRGYAGGAEGAGDGHDHPADCPHARAAGHGG